METLRLQPQFTSSNPQQSIEAAINSIFPISSEENKTTRIRKALGETAQSLSNEQIETIITEFQFLIDSWLDEFEKEIFGGLSIKEVINEQP